jgi:hypothetical protein
MSKQFNKITLLFKWYIFVVCLQRPIGINNDYEQQEGEAKKHSQMEIQATTPLQKAHKMHVRGKLDHISLSHEINVTKT